MRILEMVQRLEEQTRAEGGPTFIRLEDQTRGEGGPTSLASCGFCGAPPEEAPPGTPAGAHPHWRPAPDPASGRLVQDPEFTLQSTAGPITWRLYYDSADAATFRNYGYGRRGSFPVYLNNDGATVTVMHEDGTSRQYQLSGGAYTVVGARNGDGLVKNADNTWDETRGDAGFVYHYPAGDAVSLSYRATPQGQQLTTYYLSGRLRALVDPAGRRVTIQYTSGLGIKIWYVQDWANRRHTFTYGTAGYSLSTGDLTEVMGPTGCLTRYGYDNNHLL